VKRRFVKSTPRNIGSARHNPALRGIALNVR
jgi:hypothetical protein